MTYLVNGSTIWKGKLFLAQMQEVISLSREIADEAAYRLCLKCKLSETQIT